VRNSARMLHRLIGAHIRLDVRLEDPLPAVRADRSQLEQVLMNLVVNARDAMPVGGVLTVTTATTDVPRTQREQRVMPRGRYVQLAVTDTGIGMDDSTRTRIFEPFFTTKERGRGTGLGLATVYGIVKQSGGFIWVASTPGAGTTFDIFLPALTVRAESGRRRPVETPLDLAAAGETVLVVEDEDSVRRLAHEVLTRVGYRVLDAADGVAAISLAEQHSGPIDLLLTDIVLPGISGIAVAESLRRTRPDVRVLYTSGYSRETHVVGMLADVPHQLLPKPFTRESLLRAVRHALTASPGETVHHA
jgi:two-component system, cell cycle sensor histidine kinase and response regulator CckA